MSKKKHDVSEELLAQLLANCKNPEDWIREEWLLKHLTKLVVERALEAELSEQQGHEKHGSVANESGNTRNRLYNGSASSTRHRSLFDAPL